MHTKKRAVSERVLALSASRFGGERVRKWADHAKKWVFCAAMCIGKDTEGKLQKACKKREKWRGTNRVQVMSLGENVDTSGFRDDGWLGWGVWVGNLEGWAKSGRGRGLPSFVFGLLS